MISPCLLNVALHGLEEAAGVRYRASGAEAGKTKAGSPVAVRYADDVVVLCHTQEQAVQVKARLAEWLAPRGLAFNEDKTRVVSLHEGFDFLGFNIRRYRRGKLLIKPSTAAIRRVRERLASELRTLRGGNAMAVHRHSQPHHPGLGGLLPGQWCPSRLFGKPGSFTCGTFTYKWATWRPPTNKPKRWITGRYFGKFNKFRNDRWVFGDRDSAPTWSSSPGRPSNGTCRSPGAASPDDQT